MILTVAVAVTLLQATSPLTPSPEIVTVERRLGGSAFIEWTTPPTVIVRRQLVYVDRSANDGFPTTLVGEIDPAAVAWLSQERRTWAVVRGLLGVDLKDPRQWFRPDVLTPGESYTFGLEQVRQDMKTRAEHRVRAWATVSPFIMLRAQDESGCGGPAVSVAQVEDRFGPEVERWLRRTDGQLTVAIAPETGPLRVTGICRRNDGVVFELFDGRRLMYQGSPDRPEILGLPASVRRLVLVPALVGVVLAGVIGYFIARAIKYLNYLAEPSNNADAVIRELLVTERSPFLVLFVLAILARLVVRGKLADWELWSMPEDSKRVLARLDELFRRRQLRQLHRVNTDIRRIWRAS